MRRQPRTPMKRRAAERGQMLLIVALLIAPITFAVGIVAVDASVWQSERRGAQKDADLAALAGAQEIAIVDQTGTAALAQAAATANSDKNDEAANASIIGSVVVDNSCFGTSRLDSVKVDVDHDSRTFFAEAFGVSIAPEIGAHARACVGSITNPEGLRPFAIDIETSDCFVQDPLDADFEEPLFGEECTIDWGSQGSPDTPERGIIDLQRTQGPCSNSGGGANDVEANIRNGARGSCFTNTTVSCPNPLATCVDPQQGNVSGPVGDGVRYLIDQADDCDTDGDGRDEFEESVELFPDGGSAPPDPDNIYTPLICSDGKPSERIITIVAVDELQSPQPMPIRYFVPVFIVGCRPYGPGSTLFEPLDPDCTDNSGHTRTQAIIFRAYLVQAGDVASPNESSTFAIQLKD